MPESYSYFGLTFTSNGATNVPASYRVTLDSHDQFDGVAATVYPSDTTPWYFSSAEAVVRLQAGGAQINMGMTVATTGPTIGGTIAVSTPLSVLLVLTCYGGTGMIGYAELLPGVLEVPFSFAVTASEGLTAGSSSFLSNTVAAPSS